jgi:hypothetical protein
MGIHNNSTLMRGTLWDGCLASKARLPFKDDLVV